MSNPTVYSSKRRFSILRLILAVRETSAPYNQFSLPWADKHEITICSYFASDMTPPRTMPYFEGDGSPSGFFRALRAALEAREYDVIHVHSPHLGLLFLIATLFSFRRYAPSTILTVHDSYQNYKLRNRLMLIPVFAAFQRIVCCGRASYDSFPVFYKWLAGDRLCFVRNSLDVARVDRIAAGTRQGRGDTDDFTVVAVSRLLDIKNPIAVLTAFQQSADQSSSLVYMGDGSLRHSLVMQSQDDRRVEFTGLIPREKVFEQLLNADLFISTSRGEGLPISVLEAMACRCPVLLSDIPPHREIAEGVDFIPLVHPEDTAGFAREIKKFREMSLSERMAIGRKCRKLVEERFSLPAMHAGYEEIYGEITGIQAPPILEV
jgi:glycosyltransferase involved in cell wall biosynthesis